MSTKSRLKNSACEKVQLASTEPIILEVKVAPEKVVTKALEPSPAVKADPTERCFMCSLDISMLDVESKQDHLNECLDSAHTKPRRVSTLPSQVDLTEDELDFAETKVDALKLLMQNAHEQARDQRKVKSLEEREEEKLAIAMVKSVTTSRKKKSTDLLSTSILSAAEAQEVALSKADKFLIAEEDYDKTSPSSYKEPIRFKSDLHSKKIKDSLWKLASTDDTKNIHSKMELVMKNLYDETKKRVDSIFEEYCDFNELIEHENYIEDTVRDFVSKISIKLSQVKTCNFENLEQKPETVTDMLDNLQLNSPRKSIVSAEEIADAEYYSYGDNYSPPPRLPSFSDHNSSSSLSSPAKSPVSPARRKMEVLEISESEEEESGSDNCDDDPNECQDDNIDSLICKVIKSCGDIYTPILFYKPILLCKSLETIRKSSTKLEKLTKKQLAAYYDRHGVSHFDEETGGWRKSRTKKAAKSKKKKVK